MNTKELSTIKQIFSEREIGINKITNEEELKLFMDNTNVCGIVPKTIEAKQQLENSFMARKSNVPKLEHTAVARFSVEYLKVLLKLLEATKEEAVDFYMAADYPLKVSTLKWDFILAPRLRND